MKYNVYFSNNQARRTNMSRLEAIVWYNAILLDVGKKE